MNDKMLHCVINHIMSMFAEISKPSELININGVVGQRDSSCISGGATAAGALFCTLLQVEGRTPAVHLKRHNSRS